MTAHQQLAAFLAFVIVFPFVAFWLGLKVGRLTK